MQLVFKRIIDIVGTVCILILFSPLLLIIALLIRASMGSPVLFRHRRPGYKEKLFTLLKYRTMREEPGTNEERLTCLGRLLRKLSLDELPQLWNVLKGDLSLVGPRPLLIEYLDRYSPEHRRRHDVKPGITGWAQINGRNEITFTERFDLDIWYVDNWSLWLDFKIILKTIPKVFRREGIGSNGKTTTKLFDPLKHEHPDDIFKSVK